LVYRTNKHPIQPAVIGVQPEDVEVRMLLHLTEGRKCPLAEAGPRGELHGLIALLAKLDGHS